MIASFKESSRELYSFLKKPVDKAAPDQRFSKKVQQLFILQVLVLALVCLLAYPIHTIIEQTGLVDLENHAVQKLMEEKSVWLILLSVAVLAPILEELFFRTFITFRRNVPFRIIIATAGISGRRNKAKIRGSLKRWWKSWYKIIFYSVAILFAYVHLFNFELTTSVWVLSPFLVLPQFIAGLFLGYMRVKYGLIWSIFLHSMNNLILAGIALWFMHQKVEKLEVKTDAFEVTIQELAKKGPEKSQAAIGKSTLSFERVRSKDILPQLLKKDKKLFEFKDPTKAELVLNIRFTPWTDTIHREQIVLVHLEQVYGLNLIEKEKDFEFAVVEF